jgi:hypothetical protein|tara:strand:+ start:268 stop:393 length:126 start_codon:yes stop_codon:yes gene_type:complete
VLTESTVLVDFERRRHIDENDIDEQMEITTGDERYRTIGGD